MDWIQHLNKAITYMEAHMQAQLDYAQVAKVAGCSSFHFQRMFSYIAGVPLALYIKRRKMSLAAVDIQAGGKIIDVALKYGYASPTAFNRAFQSIHGLAPSQAKKAGTTLTSYPKINFKLIAKGVEEMEFRIEKHDPIRVLGVSAPLSKDAEKAYEEAEALWVKIFEEEIFKALNTAVNVKYPDGSITPYDGYFGIEVAHDNGGQYMIAVASPAPEDDRLTAYTIPGHTWAIFKGNNFFAEEYNTAASAIAVEERIYSEWLPSSGYEIADSICMHFLLPTEDLANAPFEIWLPVRKTQ